MTTTYRTRIVTTALIAGGLALSGCTKQAATPKAAAAAKKGASAAAKGASKVDPVAVPEGARVMFVSPVEGTVITGEPKDGKVKVHVRMGATGIKVQPAGKVVPGTGHHHIIINADATKLGEPVPKDATHIHYGGGQTETDLHLAPGSYKLTMQFANGVHQSYGSKLSATIHIVVKSKSTPAGAAPAAAAAAEVAPAAGAAAAAAELPAPPPADALAVEAAAAKANAAAIAAAAAMPKPPGTPPKPGLPVVESAPASGRMLLRRKGPAAAKAVK